MGHSGVYNVEEERSFCVSNLRATHMNSWNLVSVYKARAYFARTVTRTFHQGRGLQSVWNIKITWEL